MSAVPCCGCALSSPLSLTLKEQEHGHACRSMHLVCVYSVYPPLSLSPRRSPTWLSSLSCLCRHLTLLLRKGVLAWCSLGLRASCSAPRVVRPSTRTKPLLCRRFFSFVGVSGWCLLLLGHVVGVLCTRVFFVRAAVVLLAARPCRHSECECLPRARSIHRCCVPHDVPIVPPSCVHRRGAHRLCCAAVPQRANAPSSIYTVRRKLVGCAPGWVGGGLTCALVNRH